MFLLLDSKNRILTVSQYPIVTKPENTTIVRVDDNILDGYDVETLANQYSYIDGKLVEHDPIDPTIVPGYIPPMTPAEAIKYIYSAMPSLTAFIIDSFAVRMKPYLPDYDSKETYTVGMLVVMDGVIKRRTLTGWRTIE